MERRLWQEIIPLITAERILEITEEVNTALRAHHQGSTGKREELQGRLHKVEQEAKNLAQAISRGGWSQVLHSELNMKEKDIVDLQTELAMLPDLGPVPQVTAEDALKLAELFQGNVLRLGRAERRRLLQGLSLHVRLYKDKAEATIEWPPLKLLLPIQQDRCSTLPYRMYPQPGSLMFQDTRMLFSKAV